MKNTVHEQVQKQLEYLKLLVDGEKEREKRHKEMNIPYEPSRTKWVDIDNYENYKKEIEKNGDERLLLMVKLKGDGNTNLYGVYPFARRYVYEDYLVHRFKHGGEFLMTEDEANIVQ